MIKRDRCRSSLFPHQGWRRLVLDASFEVDDASYNEDGKDRLEFS